MRSCDCHRCVMGEHSGKCVQCRESGKTLGCGWEWQNPGLNRFHPQNDSSLLASVLCRKEKGKCVSWTWSGRWLPETGSGSRTWCCWTPTTARQPFWTTWRNASPRTWYTWVWVDLWVVQSESRCFLSPRSLTVSTDHELKVACIRSVINSCLVHGVTSFCLWFFFFEDLHWNPADLSQPVQRAGHLQQEAHGPLHGGQLLWASTPHVSLPGSFHVSLS